VAHLILKNTKIGAMNPRNRKYNAIAFRLRAAKQHAEYDLQRVDALIDDIFKKCGIARVTDKPRIAALIDKQFMHDIAAILSGLPEETIDEFESDGE